MMGKGLIGALAWVFLSVALAETAGAVTNGTQAGAFLLIANGARPAAMGEAFTGVANDLSGVTWNPAGLGDLESLQATVSYAGWFADTAYSTVSVGGPVVRGHVLTATFFAFHVPSIANVPEDVEKPVDLSEFAVGASYAWAITDHLSIGAAARILSSDIKQEGSPESAASGALIDAGFRYSIDSPAVSGGLVLQNMGSRMKYRDAESPTPFWARLGFGWNAYKDEWMDILGTFDISMPVDTRYRMVWPDGGISEIWKLSIKGPSQNRFNFGWGVEWWLADVLALRGGYTARLGSDLNTPTAGAGLKFSLGPFAYNIDYAYAFWGPLSSNVSRVTFTMRLLPGPSTPVE